MASAQDVNVQVRFTIDEEGYPSYTDALYVPLSQYEAMSDAELERLKTERHESWKAHLAAAADEPAVQPQPVSSVEHARQILSDALAQLDTLPQDAPAE